MLEVIYDTTNNEVRGWCADEKQFGNFQPKPNEAVVILPIGLPDYDSDQFYVDLKKQTIYGEPSVIESPINVTAEIKEIKDRLKKLENKQ